MYSKLAIASIIPKKLYSMQFDDYDDEFSRAFQFWNTPEALKDFFKEHENLLHSYSKFHCARNLCTVKKAIELTITGAAQLEKLIVDITNGENKLEHIQQIFEPLDNNAYKLVPLQKSKAKGEVKNSWLRLYAIRIDDDCYVITGSAIKLCHRMNEVEYLKKELQKIDIAKRFLKDNGIYYPEDLNSNNK